MNISHIYEVLTSVNEEIQRNNSINLLHAMAQLLQKMASNPGHTQFQQQFAANKDQLLEELAKDRPLLSSKDREILSDMGIYDYIGIQLLNKIKSDISDNQITPNNLIGIFTSHHTKLAEISNSVSSFLNSSRTLNITSSTQEVTAIGFTIPRYAIDNNLSGLVIDLDEFQKSIQAVNEVCTGSRGEVKIKELSTTDPYVLINSTIQICACFGKIISWVVDNYKKILDIKEQKGKMANLGVPSEALKSIDDHANSIIDKGIEPFVDALFKEFAHEGLEKGRINELKVEIRKNVKKFAVKIDNGYSYEVKVKIPEEKKKGLSTADASFIETAQGAMSSNNFITTTGTPILKIPG